MANHSRSRGPLNDPRLVERRGDLRGFSALVFLALLLIGFALVAFLLFVLTRPGPDASPTPTPAPTATAAPTGTPPPTAGASTTPEPEPTVVPVDSAVDEPTALVEGGVEVGRVTVLSTQFTKKIKGETAPQGSRWLVANVRYRATADLHYDAARWFLVDESGKRYPWQGSGDPDPALGVGTLNAGDGVTGNVTFTVPTNTPMRTLILTDDQGNDIIRFALR